MNFPPPLAGEGQGGGAIKLKGRAVEHCGTVRAALTSRTDSTRSVAPDLPQTGPVQSVLWLLLGSVALGLGLAIVWSPSFVDQTIGENGATTILGYSVTATPITGILMAIGFAFVSGLTGTFTACNVAGLSAIAPLSASRRPSLPSALRSLGWLALGTSVVAGVYGAIGALLGPNIPQLSQALVGRFPIRLIQSMVVFGILGLVLVVMGLASLGKLGTRLPDARGRYESVRLVLVGGLIGAFLIGRPFPLFVKIFEYAAATHNPRWAPLSSCSRALATSPCSRLSSCSSRLWAAGGSCAGSPRGPIESPASTLSHCWRRAPFSSPTGAYGCRPYLGSAGGPGFRGHRIQPGRKAQDHFHPRHEFRRR